MLGLDLDGVLLDFSDLLIDGFKKRLNLDMREKIAAKEWLTIEDFQNKLKTEEEINDIINDIIENDTLNAKPIFETLNSLNDIFNKLKTKIKIITARKNIELVDQWLIKNNVDNRIYTIISSVDSQNIYPKHKIPKTKIIDREKCLYFVDDSVDIIEDLLHNSKQIQKAILFEQSYNKYVFSNKHRLDMIFNKKFDSINKNNFSKKILSLF